MNIRQLAAFREVMLTGSMSEAARNLNRTQPAVSAQIAGLEDQVGLKLFVRREGRLHPVPEAHYLLSEATAVLDRLSTVARTFDGLRNMESGTIHIVAMPGPSVFLLPELVSRFVKDRKNINVSLISRSSFQAEQLLSAQRYDVGLVDRDPDLPTTSSLLNSQDFSYDCLCAVPADDPLASQNTISASDLSNKPLATLYNDHPSCKQLMAIFQQQELTFNRRFETQYFIPLLTFVEQNLAYAVVDPLSAASYRLYRGKDEHIVFRPFKPNVEFAASLITPSHRPLSSVANAFVDFLAAELAVLQ